MWSEDVDIASAIEQTGLPGLTHISQTTYLALGEHVIHFNVDPGPSLRVNDERVLETYFITPLLGADAALGIVVPRPHGAYTMTPLRSQRAGRRQDVVRLQEYTLASMMASSASLEVLPEGGGVPASEPPPTPSTPHAFLRRLRRPSAPDTPQISLGAAPKRLRLSSAAVRAESDTLDIRRPSESSSVAYSDASDSFAPPSTPVSRSVAASAVDLWPPPITPGQPETPAANGSVTTPATNGILPTSLANEIAADDAPAPARPAMVRMDRQLQRESHERASPAAVEALRDEPSGKVGKGGAARRLGARARSLSIDAFDVVARAKKERKILVKLEKQITWSGRCRDPAVELSFREQYTTYARTTLIATCAFAMIIWLLVTVALLLTILPSFIGFIVNGALYLGVAVLMLIIVSMPHKRGRRLRSSYPRSWNPHLLPLIVLAAGAASATAHLADASIDSDTVGVLPLYAAAAIQIALLNHVAFIGLRGFLLNVRTSNVCLYSLF